MPSRQLFRLFVLSLACALAPSRAHAAEECGPYACISGAAWASGEQLDDAARKREAKRNRKHKDVQLSVQVANGRGSVFVDGVWIAPVPALYVPIKPGKHDLEVRDGDRVLARGVLTIPKKGGEVSVRVF
ncbi:hypothetical protein DB30_05367 [Enhygromyxa salina]|uniref:PEGA domain protein n=1 Tax=Enhygromyxa salina TaxID=215803 RepID=A0A0C1ZD51_9BACT|nr:hypothetical protein [Enhygromyxa salina]KIG15619.1 hypothetical protein DB30_05367 [Enhygromyxa salina]